jgi:hypothetical protein
MVRRVSTRVVYDIETMECLERDSYDYEGPIESCDPATATLLAAIIGSATAVGTTAFNAANAPGSPKPPDPAQITAQAVNAETQNRQTATKEASQFLPTLQSNTSGGLSPEAYDQFASTFSGNANLAGSDAMKQLVAKFLGLDTGATFGGTGSFGTGASNPASPGLVPG